MDMKTREGMKKYLKQVAEKNKWIINRDQQTFDDLLDGLVENKKSYGYQSCPCRLASGKRDLDRDLICPCDYAPPDIEEFDACFCNLFLSSSFYDRNLDFIVVPERRSVKIENAAIEYLDNEKNMK